jgi:hypothetical protein
MSRTIFTNEQQQLLRQNPYVYSVTDTRITLTKEFKEIFLKAYTEGESPRKILENYGFDPSVIGENRITSMSQHIRNEYRKYGEFHEGYVRRRAIPDNTTPDEEDELKKLRHEVDYLKQEVDFLKKISSIRNTGK